MKSLLICIALLFLTPVVATAEVAEHFGLEAAPSGGVASKVAIDAVEHNSGIWLATGKGLNFSYDGGQEWFIYDAGNGLVSDNISALFSIDGRLWVATNHHEVLGGQRFSLSDGLSYSDDNGDNWTQIDFGSSGLNIPFVFGGDRTIFDISGHIDDGFLDNRPAGTTEWLFFTAFAGGLLASQDGGMSWRRIYHSPADSIQYNSGGEPAENNRLFSCAVDTSHGDSLFLWTGTAGGVYQYVYVPPGSKYYQRWVNRFAFCDTCSDSTDGAFVFIGGNGGLSRGRLAGGPYETGFEVDGLPGEEVSALIDIGGRLLVGTVDPVSETSTGLAVSTDMGGSFTPVTGFGFDGPDDVISDFALMNDRLYLAAKAAGLFVSPDSGINWSGVPVDTFTSVAINTVNALDVQGDTLLVGTDSGLVSLYMDVAGGVDSSLLKGFAENDSSSSQIVRIRTQEFRDDLGSVDSIATWTIHRPLTASGTPMVGRRGLFIDTTGWEYIFDTAVDSGQIPWDTTVTLSDSFVSDADSAQVWSHFQVGAVTYDCNFLSDTVFAVGEEGIRIQDSSANPDIDFFVRELDAFGAPIDELTDDTITTMEIRGDSILFGSSGGFAYSTDRALTFKIARPNMDTLSADFVVNHTYFNSLNFDDETYGITGDFIPALAVTYPDSGSAAVWVSGRRVTDGFAAGRSVGKYSQPVLEIDLDIELDTISEDPLVIDTIKYDTLSIDTVSYRLRWQALDTTNFAWNFEFVGDSVFSATDAGLLLDTGTVPFGGSVVVELVNDSIPGSLIDPGASVFAVEALDPYLWVGTGDGTVRLDISSLKEGQLFAKVDSTDEVYAFPVPFSPQRGETVDFHFAVKQAGGVTVEVYDFAMNLVARPIDNVFYDVGFYPNGVSQGHTWDGRNGRGDVAAVGVYYVKIEYESGEVRWGKLVVMP